MITYGIDGSSLLRLHPTGVERYVSSLLNAMMAEPLVAREERVLIYAPGSKPDNLKLPLDWTWKHLRFFLPKGWTHVRLSCELILRPPTVFFNPAHELPVCHRHAKLVTTVHDVAFRHMPSVYSAANLKRQEWAIKRAVTQAQLIFTVSEATKQDLMQFYKVPSERVIVTMNAPARRDVPGAPVQAVMVRYGLTPGMYILFLGRVEKKKNPITLIKAFSELRRRYGFGHPLKLVLAGDKGFGSEEVLAAVSSSDCAKDIILPGYVPDADVPALMENALCLAFPSIGEGFGMPVLEAMAVGTPVVASDIPVLREVAGSAALFVPSQEVTKWAVALDNLLLNQDLRQELTQKGKDWVQAFSWSATAKATWAGLRTAARE